MRYLTPSMARDEVTTAIRMGAVCSAPTWVMNAAVNAIAKGAATRAPGDGGEHAREREAQRHAGERLMHDNAGSSPDEQRGEDRPTDEAAPHAHGEGEDLRKQDRHQDTEAEGPCILQDALELIAAGEQRQRQRDADEARTPRLPTSASRCWESATE